MPTDAQLEELRLLFERYRDLPRRTADADFLERLRNLQVWEQETIRKRHAAPSDDDPHYAQVLEYYLNYLHNGLPLDGMLARGPEGLEKARRMDKAFSLFANTVEYSVLSAVLQDRLVAELADQPLTENSYGAAISLCADEDERRRRLALLAGMGQQVAPHLKSRMIYTGFKLLKGLFRNVGMGEIHASLDCGFRQLRDVSRLAQILAEFAEKEQRNLYAGRPGSTTLG